LIERVKVASKGKCTGFLARYILEEKELNVRNKTRHLQEGITRIFNGFDIYSDEE
jgi:hypothetical protein